MKRPGRLSEVLAMGMGYMVECDECHRQIDYITKEILKVYGDCYPETKHYCWEHK